MRTTSNIILASLLIAASGSAIAQAPPAPATPPQATAPPSPATQPRLRALGPAHHRARRHHHRPVPGTARRQTGKVGRRALPALRRRPRHARPGAPDGRQHPGDPAPRQPRRRPDRQAEIAPFFLRLSPPAGRGRNPRKARISGEGDSPRVRCGKGANSAPKSPPTTAPLCLTARRPLPYMPRVREIGRFGPRDPVAG